MVGEDGFDLVCRSHRLSDVVLNQHVGQRGGELPELPVELTVHMGCGAVLHGLVEADLVKRAVVPVV